MKRTKSETFDADYFNDESSTYAKFSETNPAALVLQRWYRPIFRMLERRHPGFFPLSDPVVEIGCGHGAILQLAASRYGVSPIGADLSLYILEDIRKSSRAAKLMGCDISALPFQAGSVQTVLAFEVFEHISNPLEMLTEVGRVLAPGGVLVASTPNPRGDVLPLFDSHRDVTHVSVLLPEEWVGLLRRAGFTDVESDTLLQPPFLWRIAEATSRAFVLPRFGPSTLLLARR
jgi:SAM-dependent methyltransferase